MKLFVWEDPPYVPGPEYRSGRPSFDGAEFFIAVAETEDEARAMGADPKFNLEGLSRTSPLDLSGPPTKILDLPCAEKFSVYIDPYAGWPADEL